MVKRNDEGIQVVDTGGITASQYIVVRAAYIKELLKFHTKYVAVTAVVPFLLLLSGSAAEATVKLFFPIVVLCTFNDF